MARWWSITGILAVVAGSFCLIPTVGAADVQGMMAKADGLWPQRADLERTKESIRTYEEVLAQDPNSVEALWKLARAHYWLGTHTQDKKGKLVVFQKGIDHAKKGVSLDDGSVECHYWLGVNYGVYGEAKGVLKSLSLVDPIKEEMEKVIQLDPNFGEGGAYRMLGRVAFKLPWIAGGSKKESVKYLKKALEIGPNSYLTHVFLAETYLAMKKAELARKELEWVLNAPDTGDPSDREDKEKAREIYRKNFE